eukprot:ANDGO_05500.mRNA.1 hypothetical protein SARC_00085
MNIGVPADHALILSLNVYESCLIRDRDAREEFWRRIGPQQPDVVCFQEDSSKRGQVLLGDAYVRVTKHQNSIFVHRRCTIVDSNMFESEIELPSTKFEDDRRTAAMVVVQTRSRSFKLLTTHLLGGRYDDVHYKELQFQRTQQLKPIVDSRPDVIVADFNSISRDRFANHRASICRYFRGNLKAEDELAVEEYMTNGHSYLDSCGFAAVDPPAETSSRGHIPVDWLYYRACDGPPACKYIAMYPDASLCPNDPGLVALSDHHGILFEMREPSTVLQRREKIE